MKYQFFRSEPEKELFELITLLESNGYTARYAVDEENRLTCLFFIHCNAILRARKMPESIIIDATYKTNRYKMTFVNIVGTNNVCGRSCGSLATYAIAGA